MKKIEVMCPECGSFSFEHVKEKATVVCRFCHFPVDVWEHNGKIEISPLYYAKGKVKHDFPKSMMCFDTAVLTADQQESNTNVNPD